MKADKDTIVVFPYNFINRAIGVIYRMAPGNKPRRVEEIVEHIKEYFLYNGDKLGDTSYIKIDRKDSYDFVEDVLMECEAFRELNLSQAEFDKGVRVEDAGRSPYAFVARDISIAEYHDFVDLDACIGNITAELYWDWLDKALLYGHITLKDNSVKESKQEGFTKETIETLNKEVFPIFKIVEEDTYRLRDVDSSIWVDTPQHELVRKGHKFDMHVQDAYGEEWVPLYNNFSVDPNERISQVNKIKNMYTYWRDIVKFDRQAMFIYHNQVFKIVYVSFSGLRIEGVPIEPKKYYIEDEDSIVVDFLKSHVELIEKDTILFHAGNAYLNGELIETEETLETMGRDGYYSSRKFLKQIETKYPSAVAYTSHWESGPLNYKRETVRVHRKGEENINE